MSLSRPISSFHMAATGLVAAAMAATVSTALAFEHIGGYLPCKLCLEQRTPYYIGVPLMLVAVAAAMLKFPAVVVRGLLLVGGLLMLWGLFMAGFHSGVEWGFWPGPADCASPITTSGGSLLDQLNAIIPPSCSTASWRMFGLSFAGWNFVASAFIGGFALFAAFRK